MWTFYVISTAFLLVSSMISVARSSDVDSTRTIISIKPQSNMGMESNSSKVVTRSKTISKYKFPFYLSKKVANLNDILKFCLAQLLSIYRSKLILLIKFKYSLVYSDQRWTYHSNFSKLWSMKLSENLKNNLFLQTNNITNVVTCHYSEIYAHRQRCSKI